MVAEIIFIISMYAHTKKAPVYAIQVPFWIKLVNPFVN